MDSRNSRSFMVHEIERLQKTIKEQAEIITQKTEEISSLKSAPTGNGKYNKKPSKSMLDETNEE